MAPRQTAQAVTANAASLAVTFAQPLKVGSTVVIAVGYENGVAPATSTITDTAGNVYNQVSHGGMIGNLTGFTVLLGKSYFFVGTITAPASVLTFTTAQGASVPIAILAREYTGLGDSDGEIDQQQRNTATPDSDVLTTTHAFDLLVGFMVMPTGPNNPTITAGSDFANLATVTNPVASAFAVHMIDRTVSVVGDYDAIFNTTANLNCWVGLAAFKIVPQVASDPILEPVILEPSTIPVEAESKNVQAILEPANVQVELENKPVETVLSPTNEVV